MLNQLFAQNFIDSINRRMNVRINVMNEKGVIIASTDKSRIGDFHILAYEIISQEKDMLITEKPTKDLIGVNFPGVNLRLKDRKETIGVIGVSGDPDKVLEIAGMTRIAFEAMYESEKQRLYRANAQSELERFSFRLFHEEPFNPQLIRRSAKKIGMKDPCPRIPVFIAGMIQADWSAFSDYYLKTSHALPGDVVLPLDGGILLLKSFESFYSSALRDYAAELSEDLSTKLVNLSFVSSVTVKDLRFFVMPPAERFEDYRTVYRYLKTLTELPRRDETPVCFFEDHLLHCMLQDSKKDLEVLLRCESRFIQEGMDRSQFLETMQGLIERDMNGEASAELLHLHRNSLFARLRRMKEILPLNPLSSTREAIHLMALYEAMQSENIQSEKPG